MALFEYVCPGCGDVTSRICPYGQREKQECDVCSTRLELQISVPAKRAVGFCGKAGGRSDITK
jgi:hypothetical protein